MAMENEPLYAKINRLEAGAPLAMPEVETIIQMISPSVKRPYGLARVAHFWRFPWATLYPPA